MKSRRIGLVFVYPWGEQWSRPGFTKWGAGGNKMKAVALSLGRIAIVFDISWYLYWMHNEQSVKDYGHPVNLTTVAPEVK